MSTLLNRNKLCSQFLLRQLSIKINQSRTILELKQNDKQNDQKEVNKLKEPNQLEDVQQQFKEESNDHTDATKYLNSTDKDKFDILNQKSLSNKILKLSRFNSKELYLTRVQSDLNVQLIKLNFKNLLIYDENDEFVQNIVGCISKELDLNPKDAKKYFHKLNITSEIKWNDLFGHSTNLEKCLKDLKSCLSKEQIIDEFDLILSYNKLTTSTKLNILKLIGLRSSLNTAANFQMLINQNEATLKELNIFEKDHNLIDSILNQLNLSEYSKKLIRSRIGNTTNLTIKQLLDRLVKQYFRIRLGFDDFSIFKKSFFSICYLDLLNIDKILNFLDHLKIKSQLTGLKNDRSIQMKSNKLLKIFKLIKHHQLIEIDNYLKEHRLEFVWNYLLNYPYLFYQPDQLINKLNYLIELDLSTDLIKDKFLLFVFNQGKFDFLVSNFGKSVFEYPRTTDAIKKYHQIVQKLNELTDEEIKSHTFTEFMNKYYGQ